MPYPLLSGANPEQRPPLRRSRLALSSLVLGVLSIPLALTVYLGVLTGLIAVGCATAGLVATRRGRAGGRAMAAGGLVAGLVGLIIGGGRCSRGRPPRPPRAGQVRVRAPASVL